MARHFAVPVRRVYQLQTRKGLDSALILPKSFLTGRNPSRGEGCRFRRATRDLNEGVDGDYASRFVPGVRSDDISVARRLERPRSDL